MLALLCRCYITATPLSHDVYDSQTRRSNSITCCLRRPCSTMRSTTRVHCQSRQGRQGNERRRQAGQNSRAGVTYPCLVRVILVSHVFHIKFIALDLAGQHLRVTKPSLVKKLNPPEKQQATKRASSLMAQREAHRCVAPASFISPVCGFIIMAVHMSTSSVTCTFSTLLTMTAETRKQNW